jgi:hypothetical protein
MGLLVFGEPKWLTSDPAKARSKFTKEQAKKATISCASVVGYHNISGLLSMPLFQWIGHSDRPNACDESFTTRSAGGLRKPPGWGHPALQAPEARCRKAQGASPGYAARRQQSPVRAMQTASPLQGSILGNVPAPGLTPWAFLHRPSRASSGEIRQLPACHPLPSLQISLDHRSYFESHRQRRWFTLTQLSARLALHTRESR